MSDLSAFFIDVAEQPEEVEFVVSKRFKDKNGDPVKWLLIPVSSAVDDDIQRRSMTVSRIPGKHGQTKRELDMNKYAANLACAVVKFPCLDDASLQDSYKVKSAQELITAMLLPGEFAELSAKCMEICGFDTDINDEIETAKN